jgi:hypothetical protein
LKRYLLPITLATALTVAGPVCAQFAAEPYGVQAIEPARALVESVGINNFLGKEHLRLENHQRQGAREHLHALVDSRVKQLYARDKGLLPPKDDPSLAVLYSWAGRLGVYGADLIYAAVRGTYPVEPPSAPKPPSGIDVALVAENLVLSSAIGGWRVTIPYHFFAFTLQNEIASDGRRTEAAVISTGTAPDIAPPGYSQATIALVLVHDADKAEFEMQWLERLQISANTELRSIGLTRYQSRTAYDQQSRMHKEFVYVPTEKGGFAVFYAGLDGTFQANRAHFIDFMRLLTLPS